MHRLLLTSLAIFLTACAATGSQEAAAPAPQPPAAEAAVAEHFSMAPAHLEEGHIFMRRTEDWATIESQMAEEKKQAALAKAKREKQEALARGEIREYIQADGTVIQKQGIPGYEYEQQVDYLPPHEWIELKDARLTVHVENKPFEDVMQDALRQVLPYTGPWRIQWKISRENLDVLTERFSLNAETSFGKFIANVADFMLNHRGLQLVFEEFEQDRILVVSDKT